MNDGGGERMTEMEPRHSTVLKLCRFHYSGHLVGVGHHSSMHLNCPHMKCLCNGGPATMIEIN